MAENGSKTVTLEETIKQKTVSVLHDVAESFDITNISKMKKDQLVSAILDKIQESGIPLKMIYNLESLPDPIYQAILKIPQEGPQKIEIDTDGLEQIENIFFLHIKKVQQKKKIILSLPQELQHLITSHKRELGQRRNWQQVISDYTNAAINLYGVFTIEDLLNLIIRYEGEKETEGLTPELLTDILHQDENENSCYFIWTSLFDNEDTQIAPIDFKDVDEENTQFNVDQLAVYQEENPRWYPRTAKEFLSFKDERYLFDTPEYERLYSWLSSNTDTQCCYFSIFRIISNLIYEFQKAEPETMNDLVTKVLNTNLRLLPGHTSKEFQNELTLFKDSLHLRVNNGYTNNELKFMGKEK